MSHRSLVLGSSLLTLALAGCDPDPRRPDAPDNHSEARLSRFADCTDMRAFLVETWTESLVQAYYTTSWGMDVGVAEDGAADAGDAYAGGGSSRDHSTTNNQEAGVDEPDLVKTNGEHLFVAQGDELFIVDAWPPEEASVVTTLPLQGWNTRLFLDGDRLLVLSNTTVEKHAAGEASYQERTVLQVVDVSDPQDPVAEREISIEGYLNDARMIDGQVYLVTHDWTWLPWQVWEDFAELAEALPDPYTLPEAALPGAREIARPHVRALVQAYVSDLSDEALLPQVSDGLPGEEAADEDLLTCAEIYRPETLADPNLTVVTHLDLRDEAGTLGATGVMAVGWNLYASQDHLTLSQTSGSWWSRSDESVVRTHLHRFALDENGAVYEGSGAIDGWLLNQFSLSEHDGYLRAATTDVNGWGQRDQQAPPASHVYVLEPTGDSLEVVGHVGDIAPNESIQSARFLGDKGFLVTYEQVDPLFTLDLSDPENPTIVGELKLPGFSTYLHPYDNDTLVGVGFAGTWEGEITGMAITLFDVSDFANPVVADQVLLESDDWSWSQALYDHHAFTLYNGVLSMPLYTWQWSEDEGEDAFSGLLVLDVDAEAGFSELGRVEHTDLVAQSACAYGETESRPCDDEYYWYASMQRSVVIEDQLYSISNYGVKVNDHRDPSIEVASVLFHPLD